MDKNSRLMAASGLAGLSFFLIANCTNLFVGANLLAGLLQLCINGFVFVTWSKAFLETSGFKKFVAFFGVVVPFLMAAITLWRVLIPALG